MIVVLITGTSSNDDPAKKVLPSASGTNVFERWSSRMREPSLDKYREEQTLQLAAARRDEMLRLMATDPEQALQLAVSRSEYAALPVELKPLFERPFSATATLRVIPICNSPTALETVHRLEIGGTVLQATVTGKRASQTTKENTPLAGITLAGRAVISDLVFETITAEDLPTVANLPLGNPDPTRDLLTGEPLALDAITTLAGGNRYLVNPTTNIAVANANLAALDERIGPHNGSQLFFAHVESSSDPTQAVDWESLELQATELASAWTETPKSVFFIRVDFSDLPGAPKSQAALAELLNTSVAASIADMSYGKTTINAQVSPMTVRLPHPTTDYLPGDYDSLYDDARAAYLALTSAAALNNYQIVGVQFPSIGLLGSTGSVFGGIASVGGSRHWIQGDQGPSVFVHEFGHNYGLSHAGFWQTLDNSVVGPGSNVEYGDVFDIMGSGPFPSGHFHMQAKQRLNWLAAHQWHDTTSSGIQRVYRFDDPDTVGNTRALRITKDTFPDEFYWVGFRPGISGNSFLQNGAYLLWQRPNSNRGSLLDTTPGSAEARRDSAIPLGKTYSDTAADIHITPLAVGGSSMDRHLDINIQFGPFPGNLPPTATLNAPPTANARTPVTLSVSATDPNSDPLAYSWDFGDSTPSINHHSASHDWLTGGSYTIIANVTDMKGGTKTLTRNITIADPLDSWLAGNVGVSRTMNHVRFLDGRFVAGGNNSTYLSFDGIHWLEKNLGNNYRSRGFAFLNGTFVSAGYDWNGSAWYGNIHHSPDGLAWEEASIPQSDELNDIAAGNGLFIAVGDNGTILRSPDGGKNWTIETVPTTESLTSIAFGNGTFITVGGNQLLTSTDGITWTDLSAATGIASWHSLKDIHFADGIFVTGGWYSGLRTSMDNGLTWRQSEIVGDADYDVRSIASGGGILLAQARIPSSPSVSVLLVSTDGLRWEESDFNSFPQSDGLTFGGGRFLTVHGSGGQTLRSGSLNPLNQIPSLTLNGPAAGSARELISFSASATDPDGDPLLLIWNFKDGKALKEGNAVSHGFAVGGSYEIELTATDSKGGVATATHMITISDPLDSWTIRSSGTSAHLNGIAFGNNLLVAVGASSGTYRTSADGVTWSGGTISSNVNLRGIIHTGTQFVAVGIDYDFSVSAWRGVIYTSPNGITWTRRHFGGPELRDVAFGNGIHLAVGDGGAGWQSADGVSWSPVSTGTSNNLRGIDFGNNTFVAVGAASNGGSVSVVSSSDGITWDDQSAGAGVASWQSFYQVEFANDRFFASGWHSKIRHSTDGGATFQTRETITRQAPGIAHGNGIYFAAGFDQSNSSADINLISLDGENWTPLATDNQPNRNAAIFFANTFITVGQDGSIRQSDPFTAVQADPYMVWQNTHFPGNPHLSGPTEDYDGDGIPNLGEYATGTDPKSPLDRVPLNLDLTFGHLTLTIPKDPAAIGVATRVQSSPNLVDWNTIGLVVEQDSPDLLVVRHVPLVTPPNGAKAFLRVVFER